MKKENDMKKNALSCIGYARSAVIDGPTDKSNSIARQESAITQAVKRDGAIGTDARLLAVLTDAGPATDAHRPGLRKLLRRVRRGGVDAVVVTRIDRLTRSVQHLKALLREFERRGVRLVSLEQVVYAPRPSRRKA